MNRVKTILSQMGNAKTARSGKKEGLRLTTVIPMRIERHHATKVIISPEDEDPRTNAKPWRATMDAKLIKALGRAVYWQHLIDTGRVANMTELARAEGIVTGWIAARVRIDLEHLPKVWQRFAEQRPFWK